MRLYKIPFLLMLFSLLFTTLTGCSDPNNDTSDDTTTGSTTTEGSTTGSTTTEGSTTGSTTTTTSTDDKQLSITLLDCNDAASSISTTEMLTACTEVSSVSYIRPTTIYAKLTQADSDNDGARVPVANQFIAFSTELGAIEDANNRATDTNGVAIHKLHAQSTDTGSGTVTISTVEADLSDSTTVSIINPNLSIEISSALEPDTKLAYGSNTTISVQVSMNGSPIDFPIDVNFSSVCTKAEQSVMSGTVTTDNTGLAEVTYAAQSCTGSDTITASLGTGINATLPLSIDNVPAGSIRFDSAAPDFLSIKGTGGTEMSLVTFSVIDEDGNPVAGQLVNFELISTAPDLKILRTSNISGADGTVTTTINSGTTPAVVQIEASFDHPTTENTKLTTRSSKLRVSTGFPDNDSFSISLDKFNPEGWDHNGEEVTVTVQLADHYNNPVPDGTAVNFETEGGVIQPGCMTESGTCSVKWVSGNPKPTDGKVTVLAYTVGEETFIDNNPSNGLYDTASEWPLTIPQKNYTLVNDIAEAYRDDNYNGLFDSDEEYKDFNWNGERDDANTIYNGSLCSPAAEGAGLCSTDTVYLYKNIQLLMSGSTAVARLLDNTGAEVTPPINVPAEGVDLIVEIADINGNSMPGGTNVSISAEDVELSGETGGAINSSNLAPMQYQITLKPDDTPGPAKLSLSVTTPRGDSTPGLIFDLTD